MYLIACQARVSEGDSGLRCCLHNYDVFRATIFTPIVTWKDTFWGFRGLCNIFCVSGYHFIGKTGHWTHQPKTCEKDMFIYCPKRGSNLQAFDPDSRVLNIPSENHYWSHSGIVQNNVRVGKLMILINKNCEIHATLAPPCNSSTHKMLYSGRTLISVDHFQGNFLGNQGNPDRKRGCKRQNLYRQKSMLSPFLHTQALLSTSRPAEWSIVIPHRKKKVNYFQKIWTVLIKCASNMLNLSMIYAGGSNRYM